MVTCPIFLSLQDLSPVVVKDPRVPELRLFLTNLMLHQLIPEFKSQSTMVAAIEKELNRFSDMGTFEVNIINHDGSAVQIEKSIDPVIVLVNLQRRVLH